MLLNAAKALPAGYKLFILGAVSYCEEPYYDKLIGQSSKLRNEYVITLKFYNNGIFQESGIFILPSSAEGCSSSLLEAMSWELYCMTSDVKEKKDIIKCWESI